MSIALPAILATIFGAVRFGVSDGLVAICVLALNVLNLVACILEHFRDLVGQDFADIWTTHQQGLNGQIVEFFFVIVLYVAQQQRDIPIHEESFLFLLNRVPQLLNAFGIGHLTSAQLSWKTRLGYTPGQCRRFAFQWGTPTLPWIVTL